MKKSRHGNVGGGKRRKDAPEFAKEIQRIRLSLGISQRKMAEVIGRGRTLMNSFERGANLIKNEYINAWKEAYPEKTGEFDKLKEMVDEERKNIIKKRQEKPGGFGGNLPKDKKRFNERIAEFNESVANSKRDGDYVKDLFMHEIWQNNILTEIKEANIEMSALDNIPTELYH